MNIGSGFAWIGRHAATVLVGGAVLALLLPNVGAILLPGLRPIVIALLALAMVRVDADDVVRHLRRPGRLTVTITFLMLLIPAVVHGVALALGLPRDLHTALVLLACAPPLASSANLALLIGLDGALALNTMVLGALVMPVTAPLVIGFTLGLDLSVVQLFIDLVINFAAAIAIALVVRLAAGTPRLKRRTAELDGLMAILMVAFIVAVMSDVGRELAEDWRRVGKFLVAVLAANFGLQTLIAVIVMVVGGRPRFLPDRQSGLTIALMSGNRNMALIIAALPASAAEPFLLFLALYQLPIYATPLLMGPIYRRLRDKAPGEPID